jgi:hypothetical protein
MSLDLLATARRLARASPGKPRQWDLKRAISTAYYALFHAVAKDCADRLVGVGGSRSDKAWRHTYRALNHGEAKTACKQLRGLRFPPGLVQVGDAFRTLQEQRHNADYDPTHRVTRADALAAIAAAGAGIANLHGRRRGIGRPSPSRCCSGTGREAAPPHPPVTTSASSFRLSTTTSPAIAQDRPFSHGRITNSPIFRLSDTNCTSGTIANGSCIDSTT